MPWKDPIARSGSRSLGEREHRHAFREQPGGALEKLLGRHLANAEIPGDPGEETQDRQTHRPDVHHLHDLAAQGRYQEGVGGRSMVQTTTQPLIDCDGSWSVNRTRK